jgi:hypothetical protein
MSEQIDELRRLLDLPDRNVVSVVMLQGVTETNSARSFAPSGDVAYVFIGPKDLIGAECRESKVDGTITYTFIPRGWQPHTQATLSPPSSDGEQ